MRKKKKPENEIEELEEKLKHLQLYGVPAPPKKKRGRKSASKEKAEEAIMAILGNGPSEGEKVLSPMVLMTDVLYRLGLGMATEALFQVSNSQEATTATAKIALRCRTCIGCVSSPYFLRAEDDLVRANFDLLFEEIKEHKDLLNPITWSALYELSGMDIPLILSQLREEITHEKVPMKLAFVDISTGELHWSSRYQIDEKTETHGFFPVAPFYVGCTNYRSKVSDFFSSDMFSEAQAALRENKENTKLMEVMLSHLVVSFRSGSKLSPIIITSKEKEL